MKIGSQMCCFLSAETIFSASPSDPYPYSLSCVESQDSEISFVSINTASYLYSLR